MSRGIGKQKIQSPYSAAFTAASMMYREMNALIPLMQDEHAQELINQEIEENRLLRINSLMSRKRVVSELQRRYNSVPKSFWDHYLSLSEKAQRVALFYVILTNMCDVEPVALCQCRVANQRCDALSQ